MVCWLLMLCFVVAKAVVVQRFNMKNGSVYYGFIMSQNTQGNMTISVERAKVCVPGDRVQVLREYYLSADSLSKGWAEWAQQNDALVEVNGVRQLHLADVCVTDSASNTAQNYKGVCLVERGYQVSFVLMSPCVFAIEWRDVLAIQTEKRKRVELSGINVSYELANGERYVGQYAGETEYSLSLYDSLGMKRTFAVDEVVRCKSEAINRNQDFFEQCSTLDRVITHDGKSFEGYIVERVYEEANNGMTIQLKDGSLRTIKMEEVKEMQRFENKERYKPIMDFLVAKDDFFISRQQCQWTLMEEEGNTLGVEASVFKKACVSLDSAQVAEAGQFCLECNAMTFKALPKLQLIKLQRTEGRKMVNLQFTYKDLAINALRPIGAETSVNGTVKVTYKVVQPGFYALYNSESRKALFVYIKKEKKISHK